jgi:hypothetical protein
MATLGQDLVKLRKLKTEATELKRKAEAADREMKTWERHCFERMDAEESEGHRTRGALYTPVSKEYATVTDRTAFIEWAKAHDEDLVQERERSADLNALVRRYLDDGVELPPGVGYYTRDYISVRQA